MPNTIIPLFIIIVAIFPGVLGNKVYQAIVGIDWRDKDFQTILRLAGFSIVGAVFYSILADWSSFLPLPLHLIPSSYVSLSDKPHNLVIIIYPYIGHLIGGSIAGLLAALSNLLLAKIFSTTPYPAAWDDFIRKQVSKHWVIIGMKNGEVYAGKIRTADLSVSSEDRDLILEEPCIYYKNGNKANYRAVNYQYIFIPAENLYSIAVVYDSNIDKKRIIEVGENLFCEEEKYDQRETNIPSSTISTP